MAGCAAAELDRLLRYIAQNQGKLSNNKRGQFPLLDDATVTRVEEAVQSAFKGYWSLQAKNEAQTDELAEHRRPAALS